MLAGARIHMLAEARTQTNRNSLVQARMLVEARVQMIAEAHI